MKVYSVYILRCSDQSYYTGVTSELEKRIAEHDIGIDPVCYTYTRRPVDLVFSAEFQRVEEAIAREKQIKGWSRRKKEALIKNEYSKLIEFSKRSRPSSASG